MQSPVVESLSSQLAQPLNQAIRQADGGQFALMLSLLYEAQGLPQFSAPRETSTQPSNTDLSEPQLNQFNLEYKLNQAMLNKHNGDANLLRSILAERLVRKVSSLPTLGPDLLPGDDNQHPKRRGSDALLEEIAQARNQGLRHAGMQAEQVSLRTGMAAF